MTENRTFLRMIESASDDQLQNMMNLIQTEFFHRFAYQSASIKLKDGHQLTAKASYSDYPQIELIIDSNPDMITAATEIQNQESNYPVIKTYVYNGPDSIKSTETQDLKYLMLLGEQYRKAKQ